MTEKRIIAPEGVVGYLFDRGALIIQRKRKRGVELF